ncbi:protein takeout-like [Schistocerca piceifrons]|uniref:protein takeout-like n=1 Tax=Schistocerca piceifrons TaxID=274613 RepID=UPI001F5FC081|nr:protein takeout-like [Schistocerca piceifrons]XP_047097513.1 protein takeout-like [Schistocerca piceifrons]
MGSSLPSLVLLLVAYASAAQLPASLKTCKQNDPDFNGCLKNAFTDALPVLVKGIPSLGLPPLDPLHFTQIKIKDSPERPVTLSLEFNEVDIIGNGNAIIDDVEMKPGSYYMKTKVHTDKPLTLVGPYKAEGKVLVLPVKGEGNSNITAPRLEAVLELFGQPIERDGEVYWDVTDYKVDLSLGKLSIDLTGLYNNDKALADNTLKFLNENSEEIAKEVVPVIQEALAASFKEMAERVFSKVPYNSVFPPS